MIAWGPPGIAVMLRVSASRGSVEVQVRPDDGALIDYHIVNNVIQQSGGSSRMAGAGEE